MVYELQRSQIVVRRMAVDPRVSRQQVGTQLIGRLKDKLSEHPRSALSFLIRETNTAGACFLKSCGMHAELVGDAYADSGDDGYLFKYHFKPAVPIVEKCRAIFSEGV